MVYKESAGEVEFGVGGFGLGTQSSKETAYNDPTALLLDYMPEWYSKDVGGPNGDLMEAPGRQLKDLSSDLKEIEEATKVQTANTKEQLKNHADIVGLTPRPGEHIEHFRARILAEMMITTSEGTVPDLLEGLSTILKVDVESLRPYEEYNRGGSADVTIPTNATEQTSLTNSEIANLGEKLLKGTARLNIKKKGTLVFMTETEYQNKSSTYWDTYEYGYDGLDSNGDPKGNGGTFAGVVGGT